MKIIEHDGKIISIIYRDKDWEKGLNFITPEKYVYTSRFLVVPKR